ncbi:MAG: hypothetical protein LC127_02600, partial [Chitinophagales bacterium]|nr:hypothetical protein [Chitinophagales bacterium]
TGIPYYGVIDLIIYSLRQAERLFFFVEMRNGLFDEHFSLVIRPKKFTGYSINPDIGLPYFFSSEMTLLFLCIFIHFSVNLF